MYCNPTRKLEEPKKAPLTGGRETAIIISAVWKFAFGRSWIFKTCWKTGFMVRYAGVAQSVEQLIRNQQVVGSSPISSSSSSQATYRLRRAFSFHYKAHRALILLLLASKPNPLRWASVWGRRFAAVLPFYAEISLLTVPSILRSWNIISGRYQSQSPFAIRTGL